MKLNLNDVSLRISAGLPRQFPSDPLPQIAFSGRSNVGKSSLINSLLSRKSLARVSSAPGKTITVNFYEVDKRLFFVDLPGYGYAKRSAADQQRWSALTDGYFTANKNIDRVRLVIQLVDARIGPTSDDRDMLSYLSAVSLPHLVAATKTDKLNAGERAEAFRQFQKDPSFSGADCILFYSSRTGEGRDALWEEILTHANL